MMSFTARIAAGLQGAWFISPAIRRLIMNAVGAKVAKSASIGQEVTFIGTELEMDEDSRIGARSIIWAEAPVTIGARARIASGVQILTVGHKMNGPERRASIKPELLPKTIGEGAWICAGAIVCPGANIAEGCVIAAGAVVTRSTQPHGLYAGNPATRKRNLATIDAALVLKVSAS